MNQFPKFSGAAPIDDQGILNALRGSDIVRKAVTERDTQLLAFRKTIAAKLAKIEADAGTKFPKLRKDLDAAVREAREAEIAWRQKADRAYGIQAELSAASSLHGHELARLEGELAQTADPGISIFISEMRTLWDECLSKFEFHNEASPAHPVTLRRERRTVNNAASIQARQTAIREAIAAAEAMRLNPDQSNVPAQLEELRRNLPAVERVT